MEGPQKRTRSDSKSPSASKNQSLKRSRSSYGETSAKSRPHNEPTATICDSGGYSIKIGDTTMDVPSTVPNCIMKAKSERKRLFVGNQVEDCRDLSGLYYQAPCDKGYVIKWEVQKPIWDYVFQNYPLMTKPLIMTQPIFNFPSIQECMDEIFFEEYEVKSMVRVAPTDLARHQYIQEKGYDTPCLIIDSGYSFTHIVPYIGGKKFWPATKRIYVGGKLLTNYLKDILSYRQLHVMEETYVINQVKEDTCFVSQCLKDDMKNAKRPDDQNDILRNYILPDFNNIRRGYVQEPGNKDFPENCQILRLINERFTVPEILMRPSNIGMHCMGIPEAVAKCIDACPEKYRKALMENVLLIGGNAKFPGYKSRLYTDIRSLTPCDLELKIRKPENPITYAWEGGKALSRNPNFQSMLISKYDYEEYGSKLTYKEFSDWHTRSRNKRVKSFNTPELCGKLKQMETVKTKIRSLKNPEKSLHKAENNGKRPCSLGRIRDSAEIPNPKIEIKPKRMSILDSLKGVDLFGKGGDEIEEKTASADSALAQKKIVELPEVVTQPLATALQTIQIMEEPVPPLHSLVKPVEVKNNYIPITTIRLPQLATLRQNLISTVRFIPIGDVLNGNTIISNVKLG